MECLNKVCLLGNVGTDPVVKTFDNGKPHASFSFATSYSWKDKNTNERKTATDWHRISCLSSPLCAIIQQYIKKGSKLYIEGSLKTREWMGEDGQKKFITEVVLNDFSSKIIILSKKEEQTLDSEPLISQNFEKDKHKPYFDKRYAEIIDDEIPF